jgi:hypothetical protein
MRGKQAAAPITQRLILTSINFHAVCSGTSHDTVLLPVQTMASSRPRPQDPVNGGWSDVALSRPSSPPPAYSSPPVEPVDIDIGYTNAVDAFNFARVSDQEEEDDDDSISSDVIAEFNRLDEQLRRQRAPVVRPVPVPDEPFPFMKLPQELREHVYDEYFNAQVGSTQ